MNTFRLQLRFLVPLLLTLGVAAYLALPLVDRLTLRWFSRDLVTRGELLTNALSDSISDAVKDPEGVRLKALFDRAVRDVRLVAVGLCTRDGKLLLRTDNFPKTLECKAAQGVAEGRAPVIQIPGGPVQVSAHEVIGVSNREPYIHEFAADGSVVVRRPASGLVTAIEPVMRACSGTWIAHGSGAADRSTVDARDRLRVPPGQDEYALRRIWLTAEEEQGYYYGFANEGMWPLCHVAHVRPVFRESDWQAYREINQRFADAVVEEARSEDPIVLVQDYHFALVPAMIRAKLPAATILTFWHIPWPNPESFGICPWRREILEGMLGSTILGFHTRFHCKNFIETVDRFLEARIEHEHS